MPIHEYTCDEYGWPAEILLKAGATSRTARTVGRPSLRGSSRRSPPTKAARSARSSAQPAPTERGGPASARWRSA